MKRTSPSNTHPKKHAKITLSQNITDFNDSMDLEENDDSQFIEKKKEESKKITINKNNSQLLKNKLKKINTKEIYLLPKDFDIVGNSRVNKVNTIKFIGKFNELTQKIEDYKTIYKVALKNRKSLIFKEMGNYLIVYNNGQNDPDELLQELNDYLNTLNLKSWSTPRDIKLDVDSYLEISKDIANSFPKKKEKKDKVNSSKNTNKMCKLTDYECVKLKQLFQDSDTKPLYTFPQGLQVSTNYLRTSVKYKFLFKINSSIFDNEINDSIKEARYFWIANKRLMFREAKSYLLIYCNQCDNPQKLHQLLNEFLTHLELPHCKAPQMLTQELDDYKTITNDLGESSSSNKEEKIKRILTDSKDNKLYILPDEFQSPTMHNRIGTDELIKKFVYVLDTNKYNKKIGGSFYGEKEHLHFSTCYNHILIIYCPIISETEKLLALFNDYLTYLKLSPVATIQELTIQNPDYMTIKNSITLGKKNNNSKTRRKAGKKEKTIRKDQTKTINFFEKTQFYSLGNHGDVLFSFVKNADEEMSYCYKLKQDIAFVGKEVKFSGLTLKDRHLISFNYNQTMRDYFNQNNISLKVKSIHNTVEQNELAQLFHLPENVDQVLYKYKNYPFFERMIIATAAEKATWIKINEQNKDCYIIFKDDILKCSRTFSHLLSQVLLTKIDCGFMVIAKRDTYLKIENYPALLDFFHANNFDIPEVSSLTHNNKKTKRKAKSLSFHVNTEKEQKNIEKDSQSLFPFLTKNQYTDCVTQIKSKLPARLRDSFQLTPKTTFYLKLPDDVILFNALLQVVRGENVRFKKLADWEDHFCIKIVDSLSQNRFEFGVFAAENVHFKPETPLGHYGNFIQQSTPPKDLTYSYEVDAGYFDPLTENNEIHLTTPMLMNTTISECDAFVRILHNENKLDVIVSNLTQEESIFLEEGQQVFNFYSPNYLPVLEQKNLSFVPLNQYHTNTTLNEEFPEKCLAEDYVLARNLDKPAQKNLMSVLKQHSFFANNKLKKENKKLFVPKIAAAILNNNDTQWEDNPLCTQKEYPLLVTQEDKLCPRHEQPEITPLMLACFCGNNAAIKFLLALNVLINRADINLDTAVNYALKNTNVSNSTLELLSASNKLDVTVQNKEGNTPIHLALAGKKNKEIIQSLLKANLYSLDYLTLTNNQDESVLDIALTTEDDEIISVFNQGC